MASFRSETGYGVFEIHDCPVTSSLSVVWKVSVVMIPYWSIVGICQVCSFSVNTNLFIEKLAYILLLRLNSSVTSKVDHSPILPFLLGNFKCLFD